MLCSLAPCRLCDPLRPYSKALLSKSCRNKPNFSGLNSLEFGIFTFLIIGVSQNMMCMFLTDGLTIFPSSPNCRLCLAYGGSDVSRCFYWLMQRAGFPYRECQLTNKMDCLLLQHLKETFCHLDQVRTELLLLVILAPGKM